MRRGRARRGGSGGQGEYTMEFVRYEELPANLAAKVIAQSSDDRAEVSA